MSSIDDRSYLYGDALFETVRVDEGGPLALDRHIERFERSAAALGFLPNCIAHGVSALEELRTVGPGVYRVTVSREDPHAPFAGSGGVTTRSRALLRGVRPRLCTVPLYLPDDELAEHKTTSYLRSVEARRRALENGADDAILVSRGGRVGEASSSNVFLSLAGRLATPPIRGVLPGVTRARVMEAFDVQERELSVADLEEATEIILTNAAQLAVSAASLNDVGLDELWGPRIVQALSQRSSREP